MCLSGKSTNHAIADLMPFILHEAFNIPNISTKEWQIRGTLVPVTAIECVTKTQVKFDISAAIRGETLTLQTAKEELNSLTEDWNKPEWKELDWTKIKDLQFLEILEARKQHIRQAEDATCISCPNFLRHFAMRHEEYILNENISQLKQLISDQNLQLLPDYEQRVAVLKELAFIDENDSVQLKGRVACEVGSIF